MPVVHQPWCLPFCLRCAGLLDQAWVSAGKFSKILENKYRQIGGPLLAFGSRHGLHGGRFTAQR